MRTLQELHISASEGSIEIDKLKLQIDVIMRKSEPSMSELVTIRQSCMDMMECLTAIHHWAMIASIEGKKKATQEELK
jgi:hypothetical protein